VSECPKGYYSADIPLHEPDIEKFCKEGTDLTRVWCIKNCCTFWDCNNEP